ncbi:MAG: class I SAM-dependent rRNA methyltransferase [Elusimicrobiota bacterium]|jgi:23S rRNA (cytosine1962-C5)-methyltransferase|nr:class I SAM-dependent rRNA methyltransferase [Elusimicrobiota bacterium]
MKKIILKAGEGKRVKSGHKWVFSNEIKMLQNSESEIEKDGQKDSVFALLYDNNEAFIAKGFYNPHSLIAFRLLSLQDEKIDIEFWKKKISAANDLRKQIYPKSKSYRAVFSESDNMPSVIIDKFGDYLSVQFNCAGADACKEDILSAAKEIFKSKGIYIRNDSSLRKFENLPNENAVYFGNIPKEIEIEENGLKFYIDLLEGQKTGFFFDQRDNRTKLASYAKDKKVLDCFCHTGAFGIYAKAAGAKDIVFVDSSRPALELAEKNFNANNFKDFNGIEADALAYLESAQAQKEKFDIINIDPPSLIKNKKDFNAGYKLYAKINAAAIALLNNGGILASSSCSHHLSYKDFNAMLGEAASKAKRTVQILEYGFQAKDHPILPLMPETQYLNFAIAIAR